MLAIFWKSHHPGRRGWSAQYKPAVFYHDTSQRRVAEETRAEQVKRYGTVYTELLPLDRFYLAEAYHQKYWLQNHAELRKELADFYPELADFVRSTAVARINGFLGGHATRSQPEQEIHRLGLSSAGQELLREYAR